MKAMFEKFKFVSQSHGLSGGLSSSMNCILTSRMSPLCVFCLCFCLPVRHVAAPKREKSTAIQEADKNDSERQQYSGSKRSNRHMQNNAHSLLHQYGCHF